MFKLFDEEHNFVMLLDKNLQNLQLHEVLETGLASMNFEVPCGEPYVSALRLERYI